MRGILLTSYEFQILKALQIPEKPKEVSIETGINKTGIYKMLHRLEDKGLIERYNKIYHLTQNGREVLQSHLQSRGKI